MISYASHFSPYSNKFIKVVVPDDKIAKIDDLVNNLVRVKLREGHHIIDSGQEIKRFTTGFLGEAAVEEYLGIDIIDWTIGESTIYHVPDIQIGNLKIGIKTVEFGKFPVIFKQNYYPQIINVGLSRNTVLICGFASKSILDQFQSDELILSPNLRNRGTKTGFYGFCYLEMFKNLDDLVLKASKNSKY